MRTALSISVKCKDGQTAAMLVSVLSPDNVGVPRDMMFRMVTRGESVLFAVESDRASSVLSTVHGILDDISLFQEVWLLSHPRHARA